MIVRAVTEADLGDLIGLSESAGWNQNEEDWKRLLRLASCYGIEIDGRVVSSLSVACYGATLAWIGMVLTLPDYRGRGCASTLMKTGMDDALGRQIACIKLDATEAGAPVYRKFGFEDECVVERWRSQGPAPRPSELTAGGEPDWGLDLAAFGADRRALLTSLPNLCADPSGYAMQRPGRNLAHFGPCVASNKEAAQSLAEWAAIEPSFWDLFESHSDAKQIAHGLGFTPARRLLRMSYQGRDLSQDPSLVYALGGFEWG